MKAKKSFGQHFLNQEPIAERIALSLSLTDTYKQILEVGPGMGMLTKYLMEYEKHELRVVEADKDMVAYLTHNYKELAPNIISEDFLKVRLQDFFEGQFALIGNFPYNISSQIMFKMLDYKEQIPEMVGMFQKEVAERIAAKPNTKAYGIISVLMQAYYDAEYLFTVGPECFTPPPKVQSAVIRLVRKPDYVELGCDPRRFKQIVKATFGMRRKMLRNTIKPFINKSFIQEHDIFQKRPENLSVSDFIYLTKMSFEHPAQ
jgi:16S rRNA (adenine1518-N6/adenine1519-N6)-dimethyltransferase